MSEHTIVETTKSKLKAGWNKAKKPVLITAGAVATIGVATAVVKARSKAESQSADAEPTDLDMAWAEEALQS